MNNTMVGSSPAFTRMRNAARLVAATDVGVLLVGELGSGRATLAREIHEHSPRAQCPFVPFTCAGALGECLAGMAARVAEGSGPVVGTLYLDEVGDLGPADQARLYHAITVADRGPAAGAPRIIAATAQDLGSEVTQGRFRRDLELRLSVVPLAVPPLRERVLDIPALTTHFIAAVAARHALPAIRLNAGAQRLFRHYGWPGNVRELANLCERLTILFPGGQIAPTDLPQAMITGHPRPEETSGFRLPPQGLDLKGLEADLIRQALALAGGNKSRAARLLGLTRDTLLYRIQKHLIPA